MDIKYALLGFLSWKSFSGYELKKIFADSPYFYWSGSNNQIYRTLLQFHKEGLVDVTVEQDPPRPPRKMYTINERGREELKKQVESAPELPQIRNSFLAQLAWADLLDADEMTALLDAYRHEVEMHITMLEEKERRGTTRPRRNTREELLWDMVSANIMHSYHSELEWIDTVKTKLEEV